MSLPCWLLGLGHHRNGASRPLGEAGLVGGFQNDAFQHLPGRLRSQKWLLSTSASPGWVLVASFLTRQLFKISKGSDPAPFIWQPLLWVLEHVRFCVCPLKSRVCVFYSPLGFPNASLSGLQSWKGPLQSMGSSSPCRSPSLGSPLWDLGPSPWQNPSNYDYHTLFWSPTNRYGSQLYCVSTLPPIPVGFFFLSFFLFFCCTSWYVGS